MGRGVSEPDRQASYRKICLKNTVATNRPESTKTHIYKPWPAEAPARAQECPPPPGLLCSATSRCSTSCSTSSSPPPRCR